MKTLKAQIPALFILLLLAATSTIPLTLSAQVALPHVFSGTAFIDGLPAPHGATITALIDESIVGEAAVLRPAGGSSTYKLTVGGAARGDLITFKVSGHPAGETAVFSPGGRSLLDLHAVTSSSTTSPYDTDGDGLIEISNLEQLDAIRHDPDGDGVPYGTDSDETAYAAAFPTAEDQAVCNNCNGYELARSLDFNDSSSYASGSVNTTWTTGEGWLPVRWADSTVTLDGNGNSIANLYIRRPSTRHVGLFSYISGARLRHIGLADMEVTGGNVVGGLVALVGGGGPSFIIGSYATGSVSGNDQVGGLVGTNSRGDISGSYASGSVSGNDAVGGLVGTNSFGIIRGSYADSSVSGNLAVGGLTGYTSNSTISGSYAAGSVSGKDRVGGLVGATGAIPHHLFVNDISGSYATSNVSGTGNTGGLVGVRYSEPEAATITVSYWNTQTSGQTSGVGEGDSSGVQGKTIAELQSPTGYTGIYAAWDDTEAGDVWDFGDGSQYPALKADLDGDGTATAAEFGGQGRETALPPGVSVSRAGTGLVRIGTAIPVAATFTEAVTGFTVDEVTVGNGTIGNFSGSGAAYTFDVTPNAIGQVTVDITADVAMDSDGNGNTAAEQFQLGIPYDDNRNGVIERNEVIRAITDYRRGDGSVTRSQVIALIHLYRSPPAGS